MRSEEVARQVCEIRTQKIFAHVVKRNPSVAVIEFHYSVVAVCVGNLRNVRFRREEVHVVCDVRYDDLSVHAYDGNVSDAEDISADCVSVLVSSRRSYRESLFAFAYLR